MKNNPIAKLNLEQVYNSMSLDSCRISADRMGPFPGTYQYNMVFQLNAATYCNTVMPPNLHNIRVSYTPTNDQNSTINWQVEMIDSAGNQVANIITFVSYFAFYIDLSQTVTSISTGQSNNINAFLDTAESYTNALAIFFKACVAFENYYLDVYGNPVLSEYVFHVEQVDGNVSSVVPHYVLDWRLTPFDELSNNALTKFANRNLPPPPSPSTSSLLARRSTPSQSLPTTVPNPSARITAVFTNTPDDLNIASISYSVFDVNAYELVDTRLTIIPNLPTSRTYRSDITIGNPGHLFFGHTLWVPGSNLRTQLATLANYSCSSTFTEINLIAYALAKYILAAIMYGKFELEYVTQNYHYQFMKDLAVSRFSDFVELFEDPTYGIVGFEVYFR